MASRLPTPIEVRPTEFRCCVAGSPLFGFTETVDFGAYSGNVNSQWLTQNVWIDSNGAASGVAWGICCNSELVIRIFGNMRVLAPGEDDIGVYLNGVLLWSASADTAAGQAYYNHYFGGPTADPFATYPYYEGTLGSEQLYHEMTIPLVTLACGNVLSLEGGTNNSYAMAPAGADWDCKVISLS